MKKVPRKSTVKKIETSRQTTDTKFVFVVVNFSDIPTKFEALMKVKKAIAENRLYLIFSDVPVHSGSLVFRLDLGKVVRVRECAHSYFFKVGEEKKLGYKTSYNRPGRLEFTYEV